MKLPSAIMERLGPMYAKHSKLVKLVEADASGAKANTKHLESRLEVIQGHTSLKSRRGTAYYCIIMWALESEMS